jgi:hypothetical protein
MHGQTLDGKECLVFPSGVAAVSAPGAVQKRWNVIVCSVNGSDRERGIVWSVMLDAML